MAVKGKINMAVRRKPAAARKDAHIDIAMSPIAKSVFDSGFDRLGLNIVHCQT